jgi:sec-independent protein translocase protein TatA
MGGEIMGLDNPIHILIVLVVVLMVFGAKRLPEMGKSLGEGLHGFSRAIKGEQPAQVSHLTDALAAAPAPMATEATRAEPLVVVQSASGVEA